VGHARSHAPSRRIVPRVSALIITLVAMLAQTASSGRPELTNEAAAGDIAVVAGGSQADTTVGKLPKSYPGCDADDDADDSSDDDCAPAHVFVRTHVAGAQLSFAERVTTQTGPPPSIDLILVAPKNSPPVA
jgi:hypothetical protein